MRCWRISWILNLEDFGGQEVNRFVLIGKIDGKLIDGNFNLSIINLNG